MPTLYNKEIAVSILKQPFEWLWEHISEYWEKLVAFAKELAAGVVTWLYEMLLKMWDWAVDWAGGLIAMFVDMLVSAIPEGWMPVFEALTPWLAFASWLFELGFALGLVAAYFTLTGVLFLIRAIKAFIPTIAT